MKCKIIHYAKWLPPAQEAIATTKCETHACEDVILVTTDQCIIGAIEELKERVTALEEHKSRTNLPL